MIIQWFPGHMTKTQKLIQENRPSVDVFLELVDARAPASCRNPLLDELIGNKPRVIILNKIDVADPVVTTLWQRSFEKRANTRVVLISSKEKQNLGSIVATSQELVGKFVKVRPSSIRAMIVGIPNVGKSTLINALARGHKASVAPKPGHTRGIQKIRLSDDFELLDTPGILWHKFDDPAVGQRLAMLGAIKDDIYEFQAVALLTIDFLMAHYPTALAARYRLSGSQTEANAILEEIGRKRGYLLKGGIVDIERSCINLMNDLRTGLLGRISLERPDQVLGAATSSMTKGHHNQLDDNAGNQTGGE